MTIRQATRKALEKLGEFDYRVVNGAKYTNIRDEEDRREQNRIAQAKHRARVAGVPLKGEEEYVKAVRSGASEEKLDGIVEKNLPQA